MTKKKGQQMTGNSFGGIVTGAREGSWGNLSTATLRIASQLAPHYSFSENDDPAKVLGDYPNPGRIIESLRVLVDVMFPGRLSSGVSEASELLPFIAERLNHVAELLVAEIEQAVVFRWLGAAQQRENPTPGDPKTIAEKILLEFFESLPQIRSDLILDVKAAYEGDPAALTYAEVKLAYPGLLAIASHRIAHRLYELDVPVVPRIMSEWTHTQTGADIHPGATIGRSFFIDHCTGVVIGETAVIGERVRIYQGATLGAKSFPLDEFGQPIKHIKRHPTVEDDVILYANSVVLGGDTVIGKGATIGAGVFLMESVPAGSTVLGKRPELQIKPAK